MNIVVKTNKIPKLVMPVFTVDKILSEKLNKFDILKLMNKSNFTLFLGKAGSGKSSLLIGLLGSKTGFKKVYNQVFLFCPPNSRQSIKNGFWSKLPEEQIYDELNLENLQEVYKHAQDNASEGNKTLIILDDVQKALKGPCEKFLLHIINNRRHSYVSIWIAAQNYFQIPKPVRSGLTDIFVFKSSRKEIECINEEQVETIKDKFEDIIHKYCFKEPHDFLYINTGSQRLFSNWDEIQKID
jgi:replication-associated recombination protein RarA